MKFISVLLALCVSVAGLSLIAVQRDQATLPNGMIIKQQLDLKRRHLGNLLAPDGKTVIAKDIEFVCFNDTHIRVISYIDGENLNYAEQEGRLLTLSSNRETLEEAGLWKEKGSCNGYFDAMIGPGLLYVGNRDPFLPACRHRNLENDALQNPEWLKWPCSVR
ncbi:hypothetical protein [uncultured Sulfitobacter sp.]|uniref:hypothetical protein n=1 Tax=uncultured Sulfitobacter sp. TaxID=191468 RepID=UPI0026390EC7|nr:hypothetical protein [uncultured Sulfitobacter sp.]